MALSKIPFKILAFNKIEPPSALMVPVLTIDWVILAPSGPKTPLLTAPSMLTEIVLSSSKPMTATFSPVAKTTRPS